MCRVLQGNWFKNSLLRGILYKYPHSWLDPLEFFKQSSYEVKPETRPVPNSAAAVNVTFCDGARLSPDRRLCAKHERMGRKVAPHSGPAFDTEQPPRLLGCHPSRVREPAGPAGVASPAGHGRKGRARLRGRLPPLHGGCLQRPGHATAPKEMPHPPSALHGDSTGVVPDHCSKASLAGAGSGPQFVKNATSAKLGQGRSACTSQVGLSAMKGVLRRDRHRKRPWVMEAGTGVMWPQARDTGAPRSSERREEARPRHTAVSKTRGPRTSSG